MKKENNNDGKQIFYISAHKHNMPHYTILKSVSHISLTIKCVPKMFLFQNNRTSFHLTKRKKVNIFHFDQILFPRSFSHAASVVDFAATFPLWKGDLPLSPTLCSAQLRTSVSVYQPACVSLNLNWWVQLTAAPLLFPAAWVVLLCVCVCMCVCVWCLCARQWQRRAPKSKTSGSLPQHTSDRRN